MITLSRRRLLQAGAAGLLLPRPLLAASGNERRFLFIFARGGWDQSYCFAPEMLSMDGVSADPTGRSETINGIPFVQGDDRPSVTSFFEDYGDRTCVINGLEVRSIAHEMCTRLMLTGSPDPIGDDWAALMSAKNPLPLDMPHVLVNGPSYSDKHTSSVVRIGLAGQFDTLLDGTALTASDLAASPLPDSVEDEVEAYLRQRSEANALAAWPGDEARFHEGYGQTLGHMGNVRAVRDELDLSAAEDFGDRLELIVSCFELGLSRCGLATHDGFQDYGWDSHGANEKQTLHFEEIFGYVNQLMQTLDERTGLDGKPLSEDTTVVLFSEMGRTPYLNGDQGKDHWTFTSSVLIGAGVAGGQAIGGYDDDVFGEHVDLASGATVSETEGTRLGVGHFGATLLALADIDHTPYTEDKGPIVAALS